MVGELWVSVGPVDFVGDAVRDRAQEEGNGRGADAGGDEGDDQRRDEGALRVVEEELVAQPLCSLSAQFSFLAGGVARGHEVGAEVVGEVVHDCFAFGDDELGGEVSLCVGEVGR